MKRPSVYKENFNTAMAALTVIGARNPVVNARRASNKVKQDSSLKANTTVVQRLVVSYHIWQAR